MLQRNQLVSIAAATTCGLLIASVGCKKKTAPAGEPPKPADAAVAVAVAQDAAPAPPAAAKRVGIDIETEFTDKENNVKYGGVALWVNDAPGTANARITLAAATTDDWKAMHAALKDKRDYFVKFRTDKQLPTNKLGLYIFDVVGPGDGTLGVPDFEKTEGEAAIGWRSTTTS